MSRVTVVAKIVAREEAVESVKAELLKMIAPTRLEPGCIEYRLHQDRLAPGLFLFYENWESMAFFGAAPEFPALQKLCGSRAQPDR